MAFRLAIVFLGSFLVARTAIGQEKPTLAVMDFSDSKLGSRLAADPGVHANTGKFLSDLLVTQLGEGGHYRVRESSALDRILKTQNFSNSDRVTPADAAKLAAAFGVDTVVIGEVENVKVDEKASDAGMFHNLKPMRSQPETSVEISARLLDGKTGQILAVATATGTAMGSTSEADESNGHRSQLEDSPIGRAVKAAIAELAVKLNAEAPVLASGLIADVSGREVTVNAGSDRSLQVGDRLSVFRTDRAVTDPAIGKTLRSTESAIGTVTLTNVQPNSATSSFSGAGVPKAGDRVQWLSTPQPAKSPIAEIAADVAPEASAPPPPQPVGLNPQPPTETPSSTPNAASSPPEPTSPVRGFPTSPAAQNLESTASPPPPAPDEYALGNQIEAWKGRLKTGGVEYRVPEQMIAGVPATVTVNLHGYQNPNVRALPEATGTGSLKVSSYMKVELFAPLDPGEFTITQKSGDAIQFVPNDGYATWIWNVTPVNAAPAELLQIRISLVQKNGVTAIEQILEEKTYSVTVKVQNLGVTIRRSFWKDPIAWFRYVLPGGTGWGAIAALFAWLGGLALWKNRKKKRSSVRSRRNK